MSRGGWGGRGVLWKVRGGPVGAGWGIRLVPVSPRDMLILRAGEWADWDYVQCWAWARGMSRGGGSEAQLGLVVKFR